MTKDAIITGDSLEVLKTLPDQCVHCCVTSPPYWGLRDYGVTGQMGLEKTPEEFIEKMVALFREVRRVLRDDGTLWINIGDSYAHNGAAYGSKKSTLEGRQTEDIEMGMAKRFVKKGLGLKSKDLVGIPWLLAFALRADGWYLRQDIIWSKPNPMPESINDRCTKSHEYIFLLSKSEKYFFDQEAISQPVSPNTHARLAQDVEKQIGSTRAAGGAKHNGNMEAVAGKFRKMGENGEKNNASFNESVCLRVDRRNKRSVWEVVTRGFSEAHFATFPEELIVDCIKAGSRVGDIILDPFMGAGTTALVAKKQGRHYLGIELNPAYVEIAENRLKKELGLFA